ncbi:MAG: SRPBCC family protein [Planctomycetia bacterium]|nr:SRPBCC family protein [Planctomycetia bacterium]
MRIHRFEVEQWLPRPLEEVFAYFSDAFNLEALTPPWLRFQVLTPPPIAMRSGALIDYRLRLHLLPIRWRTEITCWEPPHRFVDRQLRGPYRQWHHEHIFEARDGGTWVRDRVDYAVPGGLLEPWLHHWWVGPNVRRIFDFRQRKLAELFGQPASQPSA